MWHDPRAEVVFFVCFVFNLEKSRAFLFKPKTMERVTDERGRTFTKQADIMNVQRDFFSNLYKKKIWKEGMEEKMTTFMET